jgi:hypothetical protein
MGQVENEDLGLRQHGQRPEEFVLAIVDDKLRIELHIRAGRLVTDAASNNLWLALPDEARLPPEVDVTAAGSMAEARAPPL